MTQLAQSSPPARPRILELAGVTKHYVDNPSFMANLMGVTRTVHAATEVSLSVGKGETLGVVGESGCGKSTLARCIAALEPITAGRLSFDGRQVELRRGVDLSWFRKRCQIVFQDPQSSLNRALTVEQTIARGLDAAGKYRRKADRRRRIGELLAMVGLSADFARRYPHELSGGQRQRVGIARALAVDPELIILDEPVSALDVSIQAQIINLLLELQERLSLTYLFISHDLNLVRYFSDRIAVMYLGRVVETGDAASVYAAPRHPYTQLLLAAAPKPDPTQQATTISVTGEVPSPINPPSGCPFHPRCPRAEARCRQERPELRVKGDGTAVACHLYDQAEIPQAVFSSHGVQA